MARLSNTPRQTLTLDLERGKSYSFQANLLNEDGSRLDLDGCTLRFVVKDQEWDSNLRDSNSLVVNTTATIPSPATGEATFHFQAAELDAPPGEYSYSMVLWTADGFSVTVVKGLLIIHPNTENMSMTQKFEGGTALSAAQIRMRGQDVVNITTSTLTRVMQDRSRIAALGRPDRPETLDHETLTLATQASIGQMFLSMDKRDGGEVFRLHPEGWRQELPAQWERVTGKPATYPPTAHQHSMSDITDYVAPNLPNFSLFVRTDDSRLSNARPPIAHQHNISEVSNLQAALNAKSNTDHRHDASEIDNLPTGGDTEPVTWDDVLSKPTMFPPAAHNHTISNVNGLTAALDGKQAAGSYAAASHTHTLADVTDYTAPDLSGYVTDAELTSGLSGKANATHSHAPADITGTAVITTDPRLSNARTPTAHNHTIGNVTGLQSALDGKQAAGSYAAASHNHDSRYIQTVNGIGPDGSGNVTVSGGGDGGGGVTDHGQLTGLGDDDHPQYALADGTRGAFASSAALASGLAGKADTDHDHTIGNVTGLQSALDGKQAAGSYAAASHNHAGTYAPALGSDDNYVTDAEKAALHSHANKTALDNVSGVNTGDQDLAGYATTTALNGGLAGKADDIHNHAINDVSGLNSALNSKADATHNHAIADVSGLSGALAAKADATHDHAIDDVDGLTTALSQKAAWTHDHSIAQVTGLSNSLATKADVGQYAGVNARTSSYTLVASDVGKLVTVSSSTARNITVPSGVFSAGQRVDVLDIGGARVTFVAGSGMTLDGTPSLVSRDQFSAHTVVFLSASRAIVVGDLA